MDNEKLKQVKSLDDLLTSLTKCSSKSQVGKVLWLGVGQAREAEQILELNPEKLVVVEALTEISKKLKRKFSNNQSVDVVNDIISKDGKSNTFYKVTPAKFSGLVEQANLTALYPNAKVEVFTEHQTTSVNDFIGSYEFDVSRLNILIMELNGYETELVKSCNKRLIKSFDIIIIGNGNHINSEVQAKISERLEESCFSSYESDKYLVYKKDSKLVALGEFRKQIADLQNENLDLRQINENAVQQFFVLQQTNEQVLKEKLTAQDRSQHLQTNLEQLRVEVTSLQTANKDLQEINEHSIVQFQKLKAECDQLLSDKNKAIEECSLLQNELEENSQNFEIIHTDLKATNAKLSQKNTELCSTISDIQAHLEHEEIEHNDKLALLESQLAQQIKRTDEEQQSHQAQKKLAESLKLQLDSIQKEKNANINDLKKQLEERTKQRDAEIHWHQENKKWAESLQKENEKLKNALEDKKTKSKEMEFRKVELQNEITIFEAQLELIKDVVLKDRGL
ncbi:hypothetical protein P7F88_22365 [Vibrio hannami]|uniref:hypothetical protein n=1 Tax=Vibrio hannami TaxID=2717094 RepID=UPI00240FF974|nr:hypothetical protein [Vibrio hannami]MDG3088656.1 hypothetical protein [Vibrio hannami]